MQRKQTVIIVALMAKHITAADCSQEIKLNFLDTFSAVELLDPETGLAQARQALLSAVVQYNQGIVDVERAKGTLLDYNNVHLAEQP